MLIPSSKITQDYLDAWKVAFEHLSAYLQGCDFEWGPEGLSKYQWRRAHPYPPCLEHLSFRCGNKIYFIRLKLDDVELPGSLEGLHRISTGNNAIACLFPLQRQGDTFIPTESGCGLVDATTNERIEPHTLVTKEDFPLTEWELNYMALLMTLDALRQDGIEVLNAIDDPEIHPTIWIHDRQGNPRWILVRHLRHRKFPENWDTIPKEISGYPGHFVNIKFASEFDYGTWDLDNPSPPPTRLSGAIPFPFGLSEMLNDLNGRHEKPTDAAKVPPASPFEKFPKVTEGGHNSLVRIVLRSLVFPSQSIRTCSQLLSRLKRRYRFHRHKQALKQHEARESGYQSPRYVSFEPEAKEHVEAINAAGTHIRNAAQGSRVQILALAVNHSRSAPYQIAFQAGNQNFLIRTTDREEDFLDLCVEEKARFLTCCKHANAHPCLFVAARVAGAPGRSAGSDWGLIHARTGEALHPPSEITDAPQPLTQSELHAAAVLSCIKSLDEAGMRILKYDIDMNAHPSIWYQDQEGVHWAHVIATNGPTFLFPTPNFADAINSDILIHEQETSHVRDGRFILARFAYPEDSERHGNPELHRNDTIGLHTQTIHPQQLAESAQELDRNADLMIYDFGELTEHDALVEYARMMNTQDCAAFEKLLSQDFIYSSQRIHDSLSKARFLEYIRPKMDAIRKNNSSTLAEMGTVVAFGERRHCVLLSNPSDKDKMVVLARTAEGEISHIVLCDYPYPHTVERSGEYPR